MKNFWKYLLSIALASAFVQYQGVVTTSFGIKDNAQIWFLILCLLILSIIMSLLESVVSYLYLNFAWLRKILCIISFNQTPYLEGIWADVSFTQKGNVKVYNSFAHILIMYQNDGLFIQGTTWNTSGHLESHWHSTISKQKNSDLCFAYESTPSYKSTISGCVGVSTFKFDLVEKRRPDRYHGYYEANGSIFSVEAKKYGRRLFISDEFADIRKVIARKHFESMLEQDRIDGISTRMQDLSDFTSPSAWFSAFLRASKNKAIETESIQQALSLWHESISCTGYRTVMEFGCYDGVLTKSVLKRLFPDNESFSYSAFDTDSIASEKARYLLKSSYPRAHIDIKIGNINELCSRVLRKPWDIMLCFHSLYYVKDLNKFLEDVFSVSTTRTRAVLFSHAEEDDSLLSMQRLCGTSINSKVPNLVKTYADCFNKTIYEITGKEEMQFPSISDTEWDVLCDGKQMLHLSTDANEIVCLLCFIVQRSIREIQDIGTWTQYATHMRDFLRKNDNKCSISFRIQMVLA